ncbi:MAG TPA: hypothetical protein VJA18_00560 [Candidatus Nanoarchaeia archaeon]|nr:hypothetical protein [Candidatus Nanoarchaeia archaeon]
MAKVEIVRSLFQEIEAKFKGESHEIIDLLESLESSPYKGKLLGNVSGIVIKELKYKNFRFYFITDGFRLQCYDQEKLVDLLLRFVRMSDKNHQQQTIDEIKQVLRTIGAGGFNK